MDKPLNIGIVGDYSDNIHTHVALNASVAHCLPQLQFALQARWIPTGDIDNTFLADHKFQGFWIAPGSPYANDTGVFELIRHCRENNIPMLGVCGGFQYMIVEFARNFLVIRDAAHAESDGDGKFMISKLACSLKGQKEEVFISDDQSWLFEVLRKKSFTGYFNCSYGVNAAYQKILDQYPMVFTAHSPENEPRAFEFKAHRFYCGTLFQPSLDSTEENPNPLLMSFFKKCVL